jgi:MFS family permease
MMTFVSLPLLILDLTHSPRQAGFVLASFSAPYFFLALPAGALVDRWNRKTVMILCDTGRALALGSIPVAVWLARLSLLQVFLVAVITGTLFVFFNVAEPAALTHVVSRELLPAATARNEIIEPSASFLGPPVSGTLFELWRGLPFLVDAVSYAASAASLLFVRKEFQGERSGAPLDLRADVAEGLSWLWRQPLIRFMAVLTGGANFVFSGGFLLVVVLARDQHAPPPTIGAIFSIAAVGGLLGATIAPWVQRHLSFGRSIIGVEWILALLFPLYALAPNPVALGLITAMTFFLNPIYNVVQYSYRLALIPDALQSRVNSVFRLIAFGTQPLGATLCGILIQSFGPKLAVLVFAACLFLLAASATLNSHLRTARPLAEIEPIPH